MRWPDTSKAPHSRQRVVETSFDTFTTNVFERTLRACPVKYRNTLGGSLTNPDKTHPARAFLVTTATLKDYRHALLLRMGGGVVDPENLPPGRTYEEAVKDRKHIVRRFNKSLDGSFRYGGIPVVVWPNIPEGKVYFVSSIAHDDPAWTDDMLITINMNPETTDAD